MAIKMNQTIAEERYQWINPLMSKELTYAEVLKMCPHGKRSLERWIGDMGTPSLNLYSPF
jgi:hypothetical protein